MKRYFIFKTLIFLSLTGFSQNLKLDKLYKLLLVPDFKKTETEIDKINSTANNSFDKALGLYLKSKNYQNNGFWNKSRESEIEFNEISNNLTADEKLYFKVLFFKNSLKNFQKNKSETQFKELNQIVVQNELTQLEFKFAKLEYFIVSKQFAECNKLITTLTNDVESKLQTPLFLHYESYSESTHLIRTSEYVRILSMYASLLVYKGDKTQAGEIIQKIEGIVTKNNITKSEGLAYYYLAKSELEQYEMRYKSALNYAKDGMGCLPEFKSMTHLMLCAQASNQYVFLEQNEIAQNFYNKVLYALPTTGLSNSGTEIYKYRIEANYKAAGANFYGQKERLTFLESDTTILPFYHPLKLENELVIFDIDVKTGYFKGQGGAISAEKRINYCLKLTENIYGELHPVSRKIALKKAAYLSLHSYKYDTASMLFNTHLTSDEFKQFNENHTENLFIYNGLAKLYNIKEDFQKSNLYLNKATKLSNEINTESPYNKIKQYLSNCEVYFYREDIDKCKITYDTLLLLLEKVRPRDKDYYFASMLKSAARWYLQIGKYKEALKYIKREESFSAEYRALYNSNIEDNSRFWFDYYIKKGNINSAWEMMFDKKRFFYTTIDDKANHIEDFTRIVDYYNKIGNYIEGRYLSNITVDITQKIYGKNSISYIRSLIADYKIQTSLGDYTKARQLCETVLAYYKKRFGVQSLEYNQIIVDYTDINMLGNFENYESINKTLVSCKQVISSDNNLNPIDCGKYYLSFAKFYLGNKKYETAEILVNEAISKLSGKINQKSTIKSEIAILLGDIYFQKKDFKESLRKYKKALEITETEFGNNHPLYLKIETKLAKCYYFNSDMNNCLEVIEQNELKHIAFLKKHFPYMSERERLKYWNTVNDEFDFFNQVYLDNIRKDKKYTELIYNNAITTKAILLNSSISVREKILKSPDNKLINSFKEYINLKEQQLALNDIALQETDENVQTPEIIEKRLNELEAELSRQSEIWNDANENKEYTWTNIRDALKEGESAVEILKIKILTSDLTSDSSIYIIMSINKNSSTPVIDVIKNGKELETKYIKYYRNCIKSKNEDHYSYTKFLEPIIKQTSNSAKTIYLSVDGVYNLLNLETIKDPNNEYVLDKYNIQLISNTKQIARKKYLVSKEIKQEKDRSIVLFGNPKFYRQGYLTKNATSILALPGTHDEVASISHLHKQNKWNVKSYTDTAASETNLKNLFDVDKINNNEESKKSASVLHIATHGFFRELSTSEQLALKQHPEFNNPLLRSGILLFNAGEILDNNTMNYNQKDGIFTAYEALNLSLTNTDLVVLSACETGLGDVQTGEGVYGFQRTFLNAGAKHLIMSLFKVSDEITQKLMVKFYDKWLNGTNIRQAFFEAKKEIKSEYPEPMFWGSFIMIGVD